MGGAGKEDKSKQAWRVIAQLQVPPQVLQSLLHPDPVVPAHEDAMLDEEEDVLSLSASSAGESIEPELRSKSKKAVKRRTKNATDNVAKVTSADVQPDMVPEKKTKKTTEVKRKSNVRKITAKMKAIASSLPETTSTASTTTDAESKK